MKKLILIFILATSFFNTSLVLAAMEHGRNGNKGNSPACKSLGVAHIKPKHLTEVLPGAEFSFWVKGIKNPSEVKVTVKNIPVVMEAEDKKHFYLFTGKLPKELVKTAARIKVQVFSRKCPSTKGWLVKIGEVL